MSRLARVPVTITRGEERSRDHLGPFSFVNQWQRQWPSSATGPSFLLIGFSISKSYPEGVSHVGTSFLIVKPPNRMTAIGTRVSCRMGDASVHLPGSKHPITTREPVSKRGNHGGYSERFVF